MNSLTFDLFRYQILPRDRTFQPRLFEKIKTIGFFETRKEMLFSIKEQITLIFLSIFLLMLNDFVWLRDHSVLTPLVRIGVITCFTYGMVVLYDTAKSIFVIVSFDRNG